MPPRDPLATQKHMGMHLEATHFHIQGPKAQPFYIAKQAKFEIPALFTPKLKLIGPVPDNNAPYPDYTRFFCIRSGSSD